MTVEQAAPRLLECDRRVTGALGEPGLALRMVSLAGLFLGSSGRVLALSVAQEPDAPGRPPVLLPLDPRLATLLDYLDLAEELVSQQHLRGPGTDGPQRFVADVRHTVPACLDVYLACRLNGVGYRETSGQSPGGPHVFASFANSDEAWTDEVSHCLGHRRARLLREPIDSLVAALRQWSRRPEAGGKAFSWEVDSQTIRGAYARYTAR
jgi:hypothetical protein